MIVIACLDQRNGMAFNHRRQSQDCVLRGHVAELVANAPLWMNHYSASQFATESIPNLNIDDAFLQKAAQGEYCFVEDAPLAPFEKWIERIIIFRWDRTYPADQYFDLQLGPDQWHLIGMSEYAGHSHDLITMEVYERCHYPTCLSVKDMKDKNKQEFHGTRDEVITKGYAPCGRCKP